MNNLRGVMDGVLFLVRLKLCECNLSAGELVSA